jgi:hypothetical protein
MVVEYPKWLIHVMEEQFSRFVGSVDMIMAVVSPVSIVPSP